MTTSLAANETRRFRLYAGDAITSTGSGVILVSLPDRNVRASAGGVVGPFRETGQAEIVASDALSFDIAAAFDAEQADAIALALTPDRFAVVLAQVADVVEVGGSTEGLTEVI